VPKVSRRLSRAETECLPPVLFRIQCQATHYSVAGFVEHDKDDKTTIRKFHGSGSEGHAVVDFIRPVKAVGNIESWLMTLLKTMQEMLKEKARECAAGVSQVQTGLTCLRPLVDNSIAQFALLAV